MPVTNITFFNEPFNLCKQGKLSSLIIASNNLGAPAKHYKAAPALDKIIPIDTNHGVGHET